jgi:hypothetical protein
MAATQASIKVTKSFSYRGITRHWSNRYYLNATSIDTQAHFNTLADAVVAAEKLCLQTTVTITEVAYYAPGSDVAVWTRTYSTAGTATATGNRAPGDCAGLIRYTTTQRSSKNHPIYLFNYYHGMDVQATPNQDSLTSAQSGFLGTYANAWVTGFSDGVTTYKKAGPRGAVATGYTVEPFVTHRDFPR